MSSVRERIWGANPFAGLDVSRHPDDTQGWGSDHPFFEPLIELVRPKLIVEVGSWKGGSALHMARLCQSIGLNTEIICIDTWLGSPEHFVDTGNDYSRSLRYQNGYPQLYYTFASNVVRQGFADVITPLPLPSESAVDVLNRLGVRADIVYIDGAHEYEPAYRDFAAYWPLVNETGVMICDDYAGWPGVTRAVNRFAYEIATPVYTTWGKAFMRKGGDQWFEFGLTRLAEKGAWSPRTR